MGEIVSLVAQLAVTAVGVEAQITHQCSASDLPLFLIVIGTTNSVLILAFLRWGYPVLYLALPLNLALIIWGTTLVYPFDFQSVVQNPERFCKNVTYATAFGYVVTTWIVIAVFAVCLLFLATGDNRTFMPFSRDKMPCCVSVRYSTSKKSTHEMEKIKKYISRKRDNVRRNLTILRTLVPNPLIKIRKNQPPKERLVRRPLKQWARKSRISRRTLTRKNSKVNWPLVDAEIAGNVNEEDNLVLEETTDDETTWEDQVSLSQHYIVDSEGTREPLSVRELDCEASLIVEAQTVQPVSTETSDISQCSTHLRASYYDASVDESLSSERINNVELHLQGHRASIDVNPPSDERESLGISGISGSDSSTKSRHKARPQINQGLSNAKRNLNLVADPQAKKGTGYAANEDKSGLKNKGSEAVARRSESPPQIASAEVIVFEVDHSMNEQEIDVICDSNKKGSCSAVGRSCCTPDLNEQSSVLPGTTTAAKTLTCSLPPSTCTEQRKGVARLGYPVNGKFPLRSMSRQGRSSNRSMTSGTKYRA